MNSLISDADGASLRCKNGDPLLTWEEVKLGPALNLVLEEGEGQLLPLKPVHCDPSTQGRPQWSQRPCIHQEAIHPENLSWGYLTRRS